jgi:hypothetical protein
MSDADAVIAIVLLVFFLTGVAVGVIALIAWSVRRGDGRRYRRSRPLGDWPSGDPDPDDEEPDDPPWWHARGGF